MPYVGYISAGPAETPPVSLWHFNDTFNNTDGAHPFTGSGIALSITNRFGGHSLDPALSVAMQSDFNPGAFLSGSWTWEFWARITDLMHINVDMYRISGGSSVLFRYSSVGSVGLLVQISGVGSSGSGTLPSGSQALDTFYHCAVVRDTVAGTYDVYFNGDRVIQFVSATSLPGLDWNVQITESAADGGFVDEMAFSDFARYSGLSFLPRSTEFPDP